jgi:cation:H+ antiporter
MAILGLIALLLPAARIFAREAIDLTITGAVAIILTALASLFVLAHSRYSIGGVMGFGSIALLVTGVGAVRLLPTFRTALAAGAIPETEEVVARATLRPWILRFAAASAAILLAAPLLASSADELVRRTGLDATFVGVLVLALATSMPELVTSLSAARAGALDLAVSNLFGSNATNMMVLVWLDLVYVRGPLVDRAELSAAAAGLVAIVLMMVGLTAIALRAERERMPVDTTALLLIGGYVLGLVLVWSVGSGTR